MQKYTFQNRENRTIVVVVEESPESRWIAFVMHGLSGFKEQPHILCFAQAFKDRGFTVVRFDTTNTFWESDWKYEDATLTNYANDLEDVITWTSTQSWYREPFILCGHSFGAISSALFAEKYPEKVYGLAPISPLVSGRVSLERYKKCRIEELHEWQTTGWKVEESKSKPGVIKRLPWSHMIDRLNHDLLPQIEKLTMPVLLIVWSDDTVTHPEDVEVLYQALPGRKELHIIPGAAHTFRSEEEFQVIRKLFLEWIDRELLN